VYSTRQLWVWQDLPQTAITRITSTTNGALSHTTLSSGGFLGSAATWTSTQTTQPVIAEGITLTINSFSSTATTLQMSLTATPTANINFDNTFIASYFAFRIYL
jgi:hypothetical protein